MIGLAVPLVAMAFSPVSLDVGEEGRFSLSIAFDNVDSPRDHARAQLTLMETARELCDEHGGDAMQVGAITVNPAPPLRGERRVLSLTMEFVCLARTGEE